LGQETTWLDSTEEIAPYGLIDYRLRNKPALLASDESNAGLVRTSADAPVKNFLNLKMDGRFEETGGFEATIDVTAQGDSELPVRVAFRRIPQTQWEATLQLFSRSWGIVGEVSNIQIDPLDDTAKPFHLTYRIRQENYFRVPSSATDFRLLPPIGFTPLAPLSTKNVLEFLDVGPAVERSYHVHVELPSNYTIQVPPAVRMSRDFGEYSSSYLLRGNVLDGDRHFVLKVNELPATRRYDYESFRNASSSETEELLSCSISAPSSTHVATVSPDASPAELQKLGSVALNRRDFLTAVDLLKRVVAADTQRKDAWDQLGRAYAGLNQHDDAIASFRKQMEVDANHKTVHGDLADELLKQGKLDDAVAAYRQQLDIDPSDKQAHKNLGVLLAQMKRDNEARTELEAANAIPPADPEVTMALAQVYARMGDSAKSASLMSAVTGASSAAAGADMFAAALADDLKPDQTLRDAHDTLDQIGDHFDSGDYDRLPPSAFSSMKLVALSWARIGWAKFLQGEMMEAMQFLNSAWLLSQSGTVANRLARLLEREGQREKAGHMFALSTAAGGPDAQASREQARRLAVDSAAAGREIAQASAELLQMRTVNLPPVVNKGSAQFALVFEGSSKPSRAEYLEGDQTLRAASDKLREKEFLVRFPEISSVKIVRRGTMSCDTTGCTMVLQPLEALQNGVEEKSPAANPMH
jgi:tetratricopeptide (TPR) repeat protein